MSHAFREIKYTSSFRIYRTTLSGDSTGLGCNFPRALEYMRTAVGCDSIPGFKRSGLTRYHAGSMAYSWDEGQFHFVQLQYFPTCKTCYTSCKTKTKDKEPAACMNINMK